MIEPPTHAADGDNDNRELSKNVTSTPRWVKVSGVVALVVILLLVILLLNGGGHGPSRHMGGGDRPSPILIERDPRGQPT